MKTHDIYRNKIIRAATRKCLQFFQKNIGGGSSASFKVKFTRFFKILSKYYHNPSFHLQ